MFRRLNLTYTPLATLLIPHIGTVDVVDRRSLVQSKAVCLTRSVRHAGENYQRDPSALELYQALTLELAAPITRRTRQS